VTGATPGVTGSGSRCLAGCGTGDASIDEVVDRGGRHVSAPRRAAITAHLPPTRCASASHRVDHQTVDRLHPLLSSPHQLAVAAVEMATLRKVVTSTELRCDQDALITGIETVLGPLPEECTMAWHRACGLFADVIAELIFNPFRGDEPDPIAIESDGAEWRSVWVSSAMCARR
jgi:hypothetical protein